ncbi:MAG: RNA polymerase sigma-70 factor [Cyclobacteriaceae bacterium]
MPTSSTSIDKPLIKRLVQGDEHAFKQVYDVYYDKLYYYCLRFVKSEELVQELLQDIFVKLWTNREKIDPKLSFNAYLYQIARNHTFDFLKEAARDQKIKEELLLSAAIAHNHEEDNLTYAEYTGIANEAIEKLPAQRKLIFQLSRFEGLSYQEIATTLGISRNTVKVQMLRALKAIRKHLTLHTDLTISTILCLTLFW